MHPYHQPLTLPFDLPTKIYGGMIAVWLLRPNLQRRFPLHKNRQVDYFNFLAWCTMIGRRECKVLTEIAEWNQELNQPIQLPVLKGDKWDGCFTVGMYLAGIHRGKYWHSQILGSKTLRHRTARWYFREGRQVLALEQLENWQLEALKDSFQSYDDFIKSIIMPKDDESAVTSIRLNNETIEKGWELAGKSESIIKITPNKASKFTRALARFLPIEVNEIVAISKKKHPKPSTAIITEVAKKLNALIQKQKPKNTNTKPFGVNLYGYANGELGIGEDVRMLALAFKAAEVPFCIINIEPGSDVSQKDHSVDAWVVTKPEYHFNIFCMTGIEMCRLVCEKGTQILEAHYNIGLWPWELPEWPEAWHHTWSLVDELWGISHFTANAYSEAPVPVIPMPLPVVVDKVEKLSRKHWHLPEEAYLFVYSFDMNSRLKRKNPSGVILAFQQAAQGFSVAEVGLVLKVSHLKPENPEWKKLALLINNDPRIHLITTELRRPEVLALYQNCDCYVSLHRSEGFGRSLAEAQLLGLSLIATSYSGNMEFCQEPTLCVGYSLVELEPGDYFYGDGQQWAEPSITQAAELMQLQLKQDRNNKTIKYNTNSFSPEYCGNQFKKRLHLIASQIKNEVFIDE